MVDPARALLIFGLVAVLSLLVFWPGGGLVARGLLLKGMNERVRMEDALKHLYHAAASGLPATIDSLAGALEVRRGLAVRLVERLTARELARAEADRLVLTEAGRIYALRIVRTHRLWERYLADRTGIAPELWHTLAEREEHALTNEAAEALAARMGHPRYDPHGDPIPTVTGELPARSGRPLSTLPAGTAAEVLHLEDEPAELFDRLLAEGLRPGARVRLIESSPQVVRFNFEGHEHALAPLAAASITVEPLAAGVELDEITHPTLADITPGAAGRVVRIAAACQGPERRRLLDLGVVPGTVISAEFASVAGDPTAYQIRGALIALRRTQSRLIQVEPVPLEAAS
ncbi:MAG: FeoA domain-containing protein [Gemmatimonadota bacterium]|nr:FeoA domain-containing protein [Gemmatimonadota bacterium]